MSKDKKKSKVKQISIGKYLLKGYNVSEWSDRGSHPTPTKPRAKERKATPKSVPLFGAPVYAKRKSDE